MSNRGGPFVEDRVVRIRRSGSGRRSYLAIAPLAAALVAVAVIGALGPRAGSNAPASSPTAVATGGALARDGSGLWNEPGDVTPPASSDPATELGLGMVTVDGGSLNTLLLPGGYAGDPMAIDGHRVFMGHDNLVVEFDLDASGDGRTILDLGDGRVAAIATRADRLAVLQCDGPPSEPSLAPCVDCSCGPGYRVWLMSVEGGAARQVGAFTSTGGETSGQWPRLAIGPDSWAVSRATPRRGKPQAATVEVHADSGKLLWSTSSDTPVLDLRLGGSRLLAVQAAAVQDAAGQAGNALGPATQARAMAVAEVNATVAVADAAHPDLVAVGSTDAGNSISADGRNVAWEDGGCVDFMPMVDAVSGSTVAATCPGKGAFAYYSPSVDTSAAGLVNLAWLAGGPQGSVLVVRSQRFGFDVVVRNADNPIWTLIQGDTLYWGRQTEQGLYIEELDLARGDFQFS